MNFDAFKSSFDRDGFIIVRQLLPAQEFSVLQSELHRYIHEIVPSLPDADAFYVDRNRPETLKQLQHMGQDAFFRDYSKHPVWVKLAESLVGEPVTAQDPEWFNKPAGTKSPTPPHQDNYYFCLAPPHVVTIWMALDPVDDENGCLRYVLGSHREEIRPHSRSNVLGFSQGITDFGPADIEREVAIHLQPGDVVAHHGNTIHRAEPNASATRHRRSFAQVFRGVSCQRDELAFNRYLNQLSAQHSALGLKT